MERDLLAITDVHLISFPDFFLSQMGRAFVRHYYRTALSFSAGIALVAVQDGMTVGFAVGFGDPAAFYRAYRGSRMRLLPSITAAILRRPWLAFSVAQSVKRVSSVVAASWEAELASIAVLPTCKGAGLGFQLLSAFVEKARMDGWRSVYLTTDARNNDRVNQFYLTNGFVLEDTFRRGSREMNKLRLTL